jgi:hypothetical protein
MYLVYRPEDGEEQRWTFNPKKIRAAEAEALEKRTGWDFEEFGLHLLKGSVLARRALLWTYLRRVHHTLRFEDVDFAVGEVELQYDKDELTLMREQVEKTHGGSDAERVQMLAALDEQIADAPEAEGKASAS